MDITLNRITAAAGACAAVAGALYVGVQINHPPADVAHVVTTDVFVRELAKATMAVLALAGFAGMFLHNRHRFGVLGLVGYVLVSIGYLAMLANQAIVATVLPVVARTDPGYVQDYLDGAMGNNPAGDIGHVQDLFMVTGIGYAIGGLLFGIALFRAGLLARWASALFAAGTVSALALAALPESFSRPFAVPVGIALMGLGASLWRASRTQPAVDTAPASSAEPAAVR
ncbi:MAG TPA: hypothetical protein PLP61_00285 [Nocardioides sp.]|uniref:hypothetical protein n=1 Tax=Nocardioides sp. TaxID=35761 RepID=UPI002BF8B5DA|nr:hypothetical protein [Nocardioides sp.]HQR25450.1 hypothetical protein [Nocardioides sp.]